MLQLKEYCNTVNWSFLLQHISFYISTTSLISPHNNELFDTNNER